MKATELHAALGSFSSYRSGSVVEETGTIEVGGRRLLFVSMRPDTPSSAHCLVISHSFFELTMLQESEIELARRAADIGIPAIYVQAPGMGDSEGSSFECTMERRTEAALAAAQHLSSTLPGVTPCFFGARTGGIVAVLAASRLANASLALWDPSFDTRAYWDQVRRLARVAAVVGSQRFFEDPGVEVARDGRSSVLGVEMAREQLDDLDATAATIEHLRVDGPALLVALDPASSARNEAILRKIVDGTVHVEVIGKRDIWQLGLRRGESAIGPTLSWLAGLG